MLGFRGYRLLLLGKGPTLSTERRKQTEPPALPLWASSHQVAHTAELQYTSQCGSYLLAGLRLFREGCVDSYLHLPQQF